MSTSWTHPNRDRWLCAHLAADGDLKLLRPFVATPGLGTTVWDVDTGERLHHDDAFALGVLRLSRLVDRPPAHDVAESVG